MSPVFLSYAREDIVWAQETARVLRNAGIEVYLDVQSNRAGDDWEERIRREIARAGQVRVGWSRHAAQSDWVRREYTEALRTAEERGADSFVQVDRLDDTPLPPELRHVHAERSALGTPEADRLLRDPYRELPQGVPQPSVLLRPEFRVVPFHGRGEILERTETWCLSGRPFDLVLYVGPGGSGKTRLFAEVCGRMRGQGWETGFLDDRRTQDALRAAPELIDRLLKPRLPRLIVVDYAESRRAEVEAILARAADRRDGQPVRVVLLARAAGDWWSELLPSRADFDLLVGAGAEPFVLPPLTPEFVDREEAFQAAVSAFAGVLGADTSAATQPGLEAPHFGQPLFLHLAALLAVLGDRAGGSGSLLDRLLAHEIRYWESVADDVRLGAGLVPALPQAIALVTLVGGVKTGAEAQRLLTRVPLLEDVTRAERRAVGAVLARLYEWEGRIEALQPDRVGEALVARELAREADLRHAWYRDADEAQVRQGLTVLGRVAGDRDEAQEWLVDILSAERKRLAAVAMEVAVEGMESVARALTEAFERNPDPELARQVEADLPRETVALRELAVVVTRQALSVAEDDSAHAHLLSHLGIRLNALGNRDEALTVAREATHIYRSLAAANPDAFLTYLAGSLTNLGVFLSGSKKAEDALAASQEAVGIWRQLAATTPSAFLPSLAMSLSNLGGRLYEIGYQDQVLAVTEEAVEIWRGLAGTRPELFLPRLARSLTNLGIALGVEGRAEEALAATAEAIDTYRRLADESPDAFLPSLASSLRKLGLRHSALKHNEEALAAVQESVGLFRRLATLYPHLFTADLVTSLASLSRMLHESGREDEALAVAEEAQEIIDLLNGQAADEGTGG